eukprot:10099989-Alexandrium_andersonii.AAC.1
MHRSPHLSPWDLRPRARTPCRHPDRGSEPRASATAAHTGRARPRLGTSRKCDGGAYWTCESPSRMRKAAWM